MTYPSIIFLILIVWSFFWPRERVLYLLFGSFAFGSLALIPPTMVSGFNLLPGEAVCMVMVLRQLVDTRSLSGIVRSAFSLQGAGLFTLFLIWAGISALTFPGLFQGQVNVMPVRGAGEAPLWASPQNFTTMAYLAMTFLLMIILQYHARDPRYSRVMASAIIFGGVIMALTGVMDVALGAGQTAIFAPFKTAQYTMMDGSQVLGMRRVEGLMSEASSYGPQCLTFAAFLVFASPSFSSGLQRSCAQIVGWGLIVLAAMSTSSAAFVGLFAFFALYLCHIALRVLQSGRNKDPLLVWDLAGCFVAAVALATAYMAVPEVFALPAAFLDAIVFKKSQSSSYADRMSWNIIALQAFEATRGLGVGAGSTRASNWAIAVISNTGVVGAVLMFGFYLVQLAKAPLPNPVSAGMARAAKFATITTLTTLLLVGTSPDFGLMQAALFAVIIANTVPLGRRRIPSDWRTFARPPRTSAAT